MFEIFIGVISGIVGGLGMGGGTILILCLSLFLGIEQHIAQSTNVIFFVPTAIAALIINFKNRNVNLKVAVPVCIWGIIGAFLGSCISSRMNVKILRKYFGVFLIIIALYQIYEYIKGKKRYNSNK